MTIPVIRKKQKKPKTRTGCVTCKQRRVKCDEAKPYCGRCLASGRTCGGYTPVQVTAVLAQRLEIRPKEQHEGVELCRPFQIIPRGLVSIDLSSEEGDAFSFFEQRTARHLRECFHSDRWQRVVLQLAHQERVIMDAAIALGSLHQAKSTMNFLSDSDDQSPLQRFALERYSRALLTLWSRMTGAYYKRQVHVILLACLLFVCFESLQHRQSAAMVHLRNGLRIIHDEFKNDLEFATTYHSAVVLKGSRKDALDEVISVFSQLDYDASVLSCGSPFLLLDNGQGALAWRSIPETFRSVAEGQSYFDVLAFDLMRLQSDLFEVADKVVSKDPNAPTELGTRQAYTLALMRFADLGDRQGRFEERHVALRRQLSKFGLAMATSTALSTIAESWDAALLQLQHVLLDFLVNTLRNTHESDCDRFIPVFRRALDLAERCSQEMSTASEPASVSSFSLQKGIVRTVYLIGTKCREPDLRRRAIPLLQSEAFRDAMWDNAANAVLMKRLIHLEEAASTSGGIQSDDSMTPKRCLRAEDIPEEARYCDTLISGDLTDTHAVRLVLAKYMHSEGSTYPEIVVTEDEIPMSPLKANGQYIYGEM